MQQSCQGGLGGRWGRTGGQTPMESTTCAALAYNSHYVKCGRPVAARPGEDGGGCRGRQYPYDRPRGPRLALTGLGGARVAPRPACPYDRLRGDCRRARYPLCVLCVCSVCVVCVVCVCLSRGGGAAFSLRAFVGCSPPPNYYTRQTDYLRQSAQTYDPAPEENANPPTPPRHTQSTHRRHTPRTQHTHRGIPRPAPARPVSRGETPRRTQKGPPGFPCRAGLPPRYAPPRYAPLPIPGAHPFPLRRHIRRPHPRQRAPAAHQQPRHDLKHHRPHPRRQPPVRRPFHRHHHPLRSHFPPPTVAFPAFFARNSSIICAISAI